MTFNAPAIAALMQAGDVPGLALACVEAGEVRCAGFGVRSTRSGGAVGPDTAFEAASLTKPVFACAVLGLIQSGAVALDRRLADILPSYLPDDPRAAEITVRQILSHTSGLPNWRAPREALRTHFRPGERFSYSGEGYLFLQRMIEALTGEPIGATVRRFVLEPLGMHRSDMVWHEAFTPDHAAPHDVAGRAGLKLRPEMANAAWSLSTTAADYGRFLMAVLDGRAFAGGPGASWPQPEVLVYSPGFIALDPPAPPVDTGIGWGLGWGVQPAGGTFFHWGDNGRFKAMAIGSSGDRKAAVVFANSATGLSIMPDLFARALPGEHPCFNWLGYERHDSVRRRVLRAALSSGIAAAMDDALGLPERRDLADDLRAHERGEDALWLRRRTAEVYPQSAGAHADLARSLHLLRSRSEGRAVAARAVELAPDDAEVRLLRDAPFPATSPDGGVVLRLPGMVDAARVSVCGNFNAWLAGVLPMARDGDGWSARFDLPPGDYEYGFMTETDFIPDPTNPRRRLSIHPRAPSLLTVA